MKVVTALCLVAAAFWFLIFSPWTWGQLNFWVEMFLAAGALAIAALTAERRNLSEIYFLRANHIVAGIGSAAVLYLIFWLGSIVIIRLLPSAQTEISGLYSQKEHAPSLLVGALLLLWIGPAEEVFWRGFVQRRIGQKFGFTRGYLLASLIYAGVHIWALNFTLFLAALVCGLFWGLLFLHYRSVWPGLISHAVWGLAVFVLLPLQ